MKICQLCGEKSIIDTEHFCSECQQDNNKLKSMTPEKKKAFCIGLKQLADDMVDEAFGPEPGTVLN